MDQSSTVNPSAKNPAVVGVVGAAALVAIIGGLSYARKPAVAPSAPSPHPTTQPPAGGSTATQFPSYKDGTFTAKGSYDTHAGAEEITITLTLKDGVITNTEFAGTPAAKMSQRFMDMFSANYKTLVIGKKISDVHLDKVSGASLTPIGFNNALEKIKQQAAQSS